MGARSYDPTTGQFLTNDPSGLAGGDTNLRIYAGNSPLDLIDPSGNKSRSPSLQIPPAPGPGYGLELPAGSQPYTTSPAQIQQLEQQYQAATQVVSAYQLKQYNRPAVRPRRPRTVPPPPPALQLPGARSPRRRAAAAATKPSPGSPGKPIGRQRGLDGRLGDQREFIGQRLDRQHGIDQPQQQRRHGDRPDRQHADRRRRRARQRFRRPGRGRQLRRQRQPGQRRRRWLERLQRLRRLRRQRPARASEQLLPASHAHPDAVRRRRPTPTPHTGRRLWHGRTSSPTRVRPSCLIASTSRTPRRPPRRPSRSRSPTSSTPTSTPTRSS